LGTNRGHDQGTAKPPPNNGADGLEIVSTGGGPPGARVRRQHGQEYTRQRSGVTDHGMALGMEPDDDLWRCLVHPPQLHRIPHIAQEFTNLPHVVIHGELRGKLGMQQQQGILQEIWGESRWEEIVRAPRQGGGDPVTPPTWRRTYQEQRPRDAQWVGRYQNKMTPSTPVRRNLASHIHRAFLCRAELIPTEVQIRAATIQDARTFLSTTVEGEGFRATAEEVYATRTKEEEMVQELLNDWHKGAHGSIPEVKEDNVI
jgi:hypothetical protein